MTKGRRCTLRALPGHDRCRTHQAARTPALTASVASFEMGGVGWQTWKFGNRAWQQEAWRLYDITGQLRFVSGWIGNSVSRCRLYVARVDEAGEAGEEAENPNIASLAAGPLGQGPAKDEALRLLSVNLFVPGEAYIVVEDGAGDDGTDRWMVVSGRQITRRGDQVIIRRSQLHGGGGDMLFRPGIDLIIRCWTPHPADPDEPDSPTRSAIPDLRELEALRKREFAELDSRLAGAGMLPLPDGIDFPRSDNDPPGVAGFTQVLQRAMATSLRDRSSAEALVPIMFKVPGEFLDKIKPVTFWSELSEQLPVMREAAIRSLAQSLDVPAEILTGVADVNHWGSWQISEDAIRTQVVPVLSRIADALTFGYLRGALEEWGEDPNSHIYAFDPSPLTRKPDRSADALAFYAAGLISREAAMTAGAFREDETPDDAERLQRLAERLLLGAPSLAADPVLRELVGIGPVPETLIEEEDEPGEDEGPAPEDGDDVEEADDDEGPPRTERDAENEAAAALVAVSNLAMLRALQLAGGRLVSHRQRDRWPDTPRHALHTRHGPVDRARADRVLAGAWDDLPLAAADLHVDVGRLGAVLHAHAADLLCRGVAYDPAELRALVAAVARARANGHARVGALA